LLVRNKGLVKTVGFKDGKYVGDPINAVRIFNEKEADELMIVDIDATVKSQKPDLGMIKKWAAECRMPLCYGGGVTSAAQAKAIIGLGVEKVAVSSAAMARPELVEEMSTEIGSQSVVVFLDVKKTKTDAYEVWTHNAKRNTNSCPIAKAMEFQGMGVGEIVVNSIDLDGTMNGYDLDLARQIRSATSVPVTVLGGAGSLQDVEKLISQFGLVGASAGSLFVFKGIYKAVLINYPSPSMKDAILARAFEVRATKSPRVGLR